MKILFLNGSPRENGNTRYALNTIAQSITKNSSHTVELLDITKLTVGGCIACDACKNNGGNCVMPDDSKAVIDKVAAADMVIFGTPVYWWGLSAQLKAVLDKFYSKDEAEFKEQTKKLGVISVGASAITDRQYSLISDQFDCICAFLGWEKIFALPFSAWKPDDLQNSKEVTAQLEEVWKQLQ